MTPQDQTKQPAHKARPRPIAMVAGIVVLGYLVGFALGLVRVPALTDASFGIEAAPDKGDEDGDGIPNGADILASARAYVATRPRYRSAYFEGGWPTDGTGVCTDVVAWGLRGAGFDLQSLVDKDIRENPEAYGITEPDPNIDYRRVSNLKVWFDRHATALTTDIWERDQWRAGDIVVFPEHIAIVSDRRDLLGVPFLIHHARPLQLSFEEDALLGYGITGQVLGHWRL